MAAPPQFARIATPNQVQIYLASMPAVPDDVKKRFPSMVQWEKDLREWVRKGTFQLQGGGR